MPAKSSVTIRQARLEHLDGVRACARAAYEKYIVPIGREPAPMIADFARQIADGVVEVAVDRNAQVVGFMVRYPRGDRLHIENLGLGARLLRRGEAFAREHGLNAIELYTNAKMTEALSFYPACGFAETDRRHENGFDRVYFRKDLSGEET